MRLARILAAGAGAAVAVRVVRSRHRRFLHPDGRSFTGVLSLDGAGDDRRVTVRVSKGIGTRGGRLDLRGLTIRVHLAGRHLDLLLSTAGNGRITRHLPVPRRTFAATYGSITAYRSSGMKVYVLARPDPDGPMPGRALDDVTEGDRFVLAIRDPAGEHRVGQVTLGPALDPAVDAKLAFDPVRNSVPELHPTGLIHGLRAIAYRTSQRWRHAVPAPADRAAVARTLNPSA